jgi:hypothetical protein
LLPKNYEYLPNKLLSLLIKHNITSVFDSGCRNRSWIKDINFKENNIKYIGGDISINQVNYCKELYPSIDVIHHDCTTDIFPSVDLVLSSDVMIHLTNQDKLKFLKNFLISDVSYLLMTDSYVVYYDSLLKNSFNVDVSYNNGFPYAPVKWNFPPWNFPDEIDSISVFENDKRLKLWNKNQLVDVINEIQL